LFFMWVVFGLFWVGDTHPNTILVDIYHLFTFDYFGSPCCAPYWFYAVS